ncbi:glycosyltransferase [Vreelandella sp. 21]|uniref:glycosyltransferase n=1 Tax=Vreelandella sp. 21 TaxID=3402864 RepID=UPI003D9A69A2
MSRKKTALDSSKCKPRLLWANPFCLLDTSSGASMSVRQMLYQLVAQGYEVQVLGATVFDNAKGMGQLKAQFPDLNAHLHQLIEVEDGPLIHQLVVTQWPVRQFVTSHEEGLWYHHYQYYLDEFKPDLVWFYGGQTLDLLIADEARARGIPSAAYLVNENYKAARWCRDTDLIITDTPATSEMYRQAVGFVPHPVGKFIDPEQFVAKQHARERLLFVNPSWPKGASVFVQLAEKLERERPEIPLEVVESRADWGAVLREATRNLGAERSSLSNVTVTPNTSYMRDPYSRARVLIAPSLWWESGARVLAESMLNGIPAIVSDSGGNRDMVGEGGMVVDLPEACFEKPYRHLLSEDELQPLFDTVVAFFDDEALYQNYVDRATRFGEEQHHIRVSTERLVNAFSPLINQRAGSKDFLKAQRRYHKHKLAGKAGKPEFKAMPIPLPKPLQNPVASSSPQGTRRLSQGSFDWQIKGKIIALDNSAKLLKIGEAEKLAETGAFALVAFDPTSEIVNPKQFEGSETIQVFQHALLGDGKPGTLFTCLDPKMSSTLAPLPESQLPEHRRRGAQVLAKLPINTIALDSIEGLESLDWLVLDELSDAATILEHGKQALKNTLLVQVRIAFQPTHEKQTSLAELQYWASRNGFRFYRFNDASYQSHFPKDSNVHDQLASELQSLEVLFLPTQERLSQLDNNHKQKLVFILHTVFGAQDMAYQIMSQVNEILAKNYLTFVEGERTLAETSVSDQLTMDVNQNENGIKRKFTPDELVAKFLPESSLKQPGSIRWLIEKEKQFGGLQRGVVRNQTSKLDPRKPHQFSAGFVQKGDEFLPTHIGGDRMSMNYHGYSVAYSSYLLPLIKRKSGQKLTIIEVGILRGTGLAIWCDLFPEARVIGLDLDPNIFAEYRPVLEELGAFKKNEPEVYSFDQFADNRQKVREILKGDKIDVFIDDGAHTYDAIMKTLDAVKPMLADEFVYFIEDFKGIEKPVKEVLKNIEITYADEMTVVFPENKEYPLNLPAKQEFLKKILEFK